MKSITALQLLQVAPPWQVFFAVLFDPADVIILRAIETWTEQNSNGSERKKSRTIWRATSYPLARPGVLNSVMRRMQQLATEERVNIFFGVAPRFGGKGRFDKAWQIRTIRALWADIDHTAVDEAIERCVAAGLPEPSIVVRSGNGVHLYWLLDTPYLIDDAGEPPAVETEWVEETDDEGKPKKRPLKFFVDPHGTKNYLDKSGRQAPPLSPKANTVRNVVAGIAKKIGGDSTQDPSRLLRVPGTLNRKDERNGRVPVPCELVTIDASKRYSFESFAPFAAESPDAKRKEQLAKVSLPTTRKSSIATRDKLNELILASDVAPIGQRSGTDFRLCCFAITKGVDQAELQSMVGDVGKFADGGERYFDRTWQAAETEVREKILRRTESEFTRAKPSPNGNQHGNGKVTADKIAPAKKIVKPSIVVYPAKQPVGDLMHAITDHLLRKGNCYIRADQLVVVRNGQIVPLLTTQELAGHLNSMVEFRFVDQRGKTYEPLPPRYGNTFLNHPAERARLPKLTLFTRNPVYTNDWRLVAPGFDQHSSIYYAGPAIAARDGTEHLDALLAGFCWRRPADRTNYVGMLVTSLLVPHFIGSKPGALFNGNQPELGKTILAQLLSIVRSGAPVETATFNPNDEEFEKRLGAMVKQGVETIIVDNAKSNRGRSPLIESAVLERCLTDHILSFRLLGFSVSIRCENSITVAITANTPLVSRDIFTRCVPINLYFEGNPTNRNFTIEDPEGYAIEHQGEIRGELIGMVERWKAAGKRLTDAKSRFNKKGWAKIVGGILEVNGEPDFLDNVTEAAAEVDSLRAEFGELVAILSAHQQGTWTAAELVGQALGHRLLAAYLGEGSDKSRSTRMGVLATRYLAERFTVTLEGSAKCVTFLGDKERNGKVYRVSIEHEGT